MDKRFYKPVNLCFEKNWSCGVNTIANFVRGRYRFCLHSEGIACIVVRSACNKGAVVHSKVLLILYNIVKPIQFHRTMLRNMPKYIAAVVEKLADQGSTQHTRVL